MEKEIRQWTPRTPVASSSRLLAVAPDKNKTMIKAVAFLHPYKRAAQNIIWVELLFFV